ncbi:MAG: ATPase-like protein [Gemmatimonadetes bacterium]|jgi:MoxR-like ATPase|nr:ATPase-like protein [Gemmatimonadota bacterium]
MKASNDFRVYGGDGSTILERGVRLPPVDSGEWIDDPAGYLADDGLRDATNVAIALGQPLLVTGEPGTGKTQFARSVAYELGLPSPFVFNTKSTSTARDLFYRYDSLRHFHDAQFSKVHADVENYIEYASLGLAILCAMAPAAADRFLPPSLRGSGPSRAVVLIDEVDKAPRDVPNDVLDEIEGMRFTVRETRQTFVADPAYRPIVILTSNSERTLPDAFLRRCVFYHIPFPDAQRLRLIIQRRLRPGSRFAPAMVESAIRHFERIRELGLRKKPSTAELLAWVRMLDNLGLDLDRIGPAEAEALAFTYSILAKSKEDLVLMQQELAHRATRGA